MNTIEAQRTRVQTTQTVQIVPVPITDRAGVAEVVKFPFKLYHDDPNWVPPFIEEREQLLNPKKNPFFENARMQFFLAKRNGEVVGTIAAIIAENNNNF